MSTRIPTTIAIPWFFNPYIVLHKQTRNTKCSTQKGTIFRKVKTNFYKKDEMKLGGNEKDDKNVWNYSWPASHIIVCSDEAEMSLYNFIIPLRAYYRSIDELRPIVLLVIAAN